MAQLLHGSASRCGAGVGRAQSLLLQPSGVSGRAGASGCWTAQLLQPSATMIGLAWTAVPRA